MQVTIVRRTYRPVTVQPARVAHPPPTKRVLLIDFDGVISRCPNVNAFLCNRVLEFMKHVTHIRDEREVSELNQQLYKTHGHTLLGLQRMGYDVELKDFNDFVYRDIHRRTDLRLTDNETLDLCSLMIKCSTNDTDLMLFSNADTAWLSHFVRWDRILFDVQSNVIAKHEVLKPNETVYQLTQKHLNERGYGHVCFIDDSVSNLQASPVTWSRLWFSPAVGCNSLKDAGDHIFKGGVKKK